MASTTREKIDHNRRRMVVSAGIAAVAVHLSRPALASAQSQSADFRRDTTAKPTVVLVHGAWADGSSWDRVMAILQADGLNTMAAPIPLTSLSDDIAALDRALERTAGPVVLVAHAYSGAVVGACRSEMVKGLVFVTSLTPDEGESVGTVFYRGKPDPHAPALKPDRHGYVWMPTDAFRTAWCQNASPQERVLLAATQRPISTACIAEKAPAPQWKSKPSWYLIAEDDRMIVADNQRYLARRMGAKTRSAKVDHAVIVTAPKVAASVILEAVNEVAEGAKAK